MAAPRRVLVHRHVDGWLLGGAGVVAWVALSPSAAGAATSVTGWLAATCLVVVATHFGASYHLAYGNGWSDVRRHPWALAALPAAWVMASAAVVALYASGAQATAARVVRDLVLVVFTLTGWHYVKQAFGVGMLAARSRGLAPSRREALLWRYGLYPIWIVDLLRLYGEGRQASYRRIDLSVPIVPVGVQDVLRGLALAVLVVVGLSMLRVAVRAATVPPLGLWGAYLAGSLWFLARPDVVATVVVLPAIHGLQYLACVHRAELDRAVERREGQLPTLWLSLFGGAAAGGLLASTWLPSMLDGAIATPALPGLFGSLLFVGLNLHHYAIDATIWRSTGEHVRRISRGPAPAEVAVERPATAPRPALA